ncbi:MAG: GntR family transcriptional regulator [Lentisphaeria bacterium]
MIYDTIAEAIAADILAGAYPEGCLPRREELCGKYQATRATVQNAVDLLVDQGLLKSHGRNGTHLRQDLGQSLTFGIAIQASRAQDDTLFLMMEKAVAALAQSKGFQFKLYHGIMDAPEAGDTRLLLADIEAHRLGGLILFWPSSEMFARFHRPWLPIICTIEDFHFKDCDYVSLDYNSLVDGLLDQCEAAGRRRVALLANVEMNAVHINHFRAELERRRLPLREDWIVAGCLCEKSRRWTERTVRFMLEHSLAEPPDALVVLNEQLAPHAIRGIAHTPLKLGRDLLLASHCNFFGRPARAPYVSVGYDIGRLVEMYVETFCRRYETGRLSGRLALLKAQ